MGGMNCDFDGNAGVDTVLNSNSKYLIITSHV
jgi:hypothetical protein